MDFRTRMSRPSQMTVRYQVPVEGGIREFRTIAGARSYAQQNGLREIRDVYRGKAVPVTNFDLARVIVDVLSANPLDVPPDFDSLEKRKAYELICRRLVELRNGKKYPRLECYARQAKIEWLEKQLP